MEQPTPHEDSYDTYLANPDYGFDPQNPAQLADGTMWAGVSGCHGMCWKKKDWVKKVWKNHSILVNRILAKGGFHAETPVGS